MPDLDRVAQFLPDALLARLDAPLAEATGLPNAAYTSAEYLELEQLYLFRRGWILAGLADEIPEPGDIKPLKIGGLSHASEKPKHSSVYCCFSRNSWLRTMPLLQ